MTKREEFGAHIAILQEAIDDMRYALDRLNLSCQAASERLADEKVPAGNTPCLSFPERQVMNLHKRFIQYDMLQTQAYQEEEQDFSYMSNGRLKP